MLMWTDQDEISHIGRIIHFYGRFCNIKAEFCLCLPAAVAGDFWAFAAAHHANAVERSRIVWFNPRVGAT